jgi:Cu/Ag efflux pump CusA
MTLAGIAAALELIADDAIVVIENVHGAHLAGPGIERPRGDPSRADRVEFSTVVIFLPFAPGRAFQLAGCGEPCPLRRGCRGVCG